MGGSKFDRLVKLREGQARLIKATQDFLSKSQQKRTIDGGEQVNKVVDFHAGICAVTVSQSTTEQVSGPLSRSFDYRGYRAS